MTLKSSAVFDLDQFSDEFFCAQLQKFWNANGDDDPSHDIGHIKRVASMAYQITDKEGGDIDIIRPAIWFHDLVNLPKNHPDRAKASQLSADAAENILIEVGYPAAKNDQIKHAIAAHSFSANIKPETLEAQIVQDADRLDAIGAIAIARTFATSGMLMRPLWNNDDPFADHRQWDDNQYSVDHFYVKLLKLISSLNTDTAKEIANKRQDRMLDYLSWLREELVTDI